MRRFRAFGALVRVWVRDVFAYWPAALLWTIGDLEFMFLMPFVWKAAGGMPGFSGDQGVAFYLATMVVSQFVLSHLLWDIAFDVREGDFHGHLMRPYSYFASALARNLAWRVAKLTMFVPLLALLLPWYGVPQGVEWRLDGVFWLSVVLGQLVSFGLAYCLALVALWTTEFHSLFHGYYFLEAVLGGRIFPLSLLPDWAARTGEAMPFVYSVAVPVRIMTGQVEADAVWGLLGTQAAWFVVLAAIGGALFRSGTRRYTGFGA